MMINVTETRKEIASTYKQLEMIYLPIGSEYVHNTIEKEFHVRFAANEDDDDVDEWRITATRLQFKVLVEGNSTDKSTISLN